MILCSPANYIFLAIYNWFLSLYSDLFILRSCTNELRAVKNNPDSFYMALESSSQTSLPMLSCTIGIYLFKWKGNYFSNHSNIKCDCSSKITLSGTHVKKIKQITYYHILSSCKYDEIKHNFPYNCNILFFNQSFVATL